MVTNALKGNSFLLEMGDSAESSAFITVAALRATSLTMNKSAVDITNKSSGGWSEALAGGGVKSAAISASGIYTDDSAQVRMITAYNSPKHWRAQIVDEADNAFVGTWNIDSLVFSGDHNVEQTFEITLSSSGVLTFVPGA